MNRAWTAYWFRPAPLLDLAIVRVIAVATQLWILLTFSNLEMLRAYAALPETFYQPLQMLRMMTLPFGPGFVPSVGLLEGIWYATVITGLFALVGFATNVSLALFAAGSVFLQAFLYSFGDLHHREAVMVIALGALALSPCGRALALDNRLSGRAREATSTFAAWPLLLIMWIFALMYASAVLSKTLNGGPDWINGFTLQYYLILDGYRWDSPLSLWLAQFHGPVFALQVFVTIFQATFWLAVLFPRLRWVYVPIGFGLHTAILVTLTAPFYHWLALYAVFVPWSAVLARLRGGMADRAAHPAEAV